MLRNLLSSIFPKPAPDAPRLLPILESIGPKSYFGFPFDDSKVLNCVKARAALRGFYNETCPIRSHFKSVITETPAGTHNIDLQDVTGCGNSKTATTFTAMAQIGWFREETAKKAVTLDEMAKKVFDGTNDCVRYTGENASITRQIWDGRMWFGNYGGSHRASAIWLLDRAENRARLIPSDITDMAVSADLRKISKDYSIFLFTAEESFPLLENLKELNLNGIIITTDSRESSSVLNPDICLIIRKDHSDYEDVRKRLDGSFDFSEWVLNPNAFEKPEPQVELLTPTPVTATPAL